MARITVEDCLDNIDNRFELVQPTVIALREIAEGLIDEERVDLLQAEIEAAEVFNMEPGEDDLKP